MRRFLFFRMLLAFEGIGLMLSCNLLFPPDREPPVLTLLSPADSGFVNGIVNLQATATDSSDIALLEFVVDSTVLTGVLSGDVYTAVWNTAGVADGSRHTVFARAKDVNGNVGSSETAHVTLLSIQDVDVFHGSFSLPTGYRGWVKFSAQSGDSLLGEARLAEGSLISDFFWCDSASLVRFLNRDTIGLTLHERQRNAASVTTAGQVPMDGTYDLVFGNSTGSRITVWTRFRLRRRV